MARDQSGSSLLTQQGPVCTLSSVFTASVSLRFQGIPDHCCLEQGSQGLACAAFLSALRIW